MLKSNGQYLFIDSGYAYYQAEMLHLLRRLLPDFDSMPKKILVTHADVDHCGLLPLFDTIYVSRKSGLSLRLESQGENGCREQNQLHKPYISICKILTKYLPPDPARLHVICEGAEAQEAPLRPSGSFTFGELTFELYEGSGGHLPGEIILIDRAHKIAFPGDIYVNIKGYTPEQAEYNRYAPILMTSVDTDPALCAAERRSFLELLDEGEWQIFGGHGAAKTYSVPPKAPADFT